MKKTTILCLLICLLLSFSLTANAQTLPLNTELPAPYAPASADTVAFITTYMDARNILLTTGDSVVFSSVALSGMVNDELAHRDMLAQKEMTIQNSSFMITEVEVYDRQATATVVETVSINGMTETVDHALIMVYTKSDSLLVASDRYCEEMSGFRSCSYVDPDSAATMALTSGSSACIADIADSQVGYLEKASNYNLYSFTGNAGSANYTKYGAWYGLNGYDWCAMFISWCANEANIPASVVPMLSSVDYIDFYGSRFYYRNEGYSPRSGDIVVFTYDGVAEAHAGIVVGAYGSTIRVVEGNYSDRVASNTYSITDSIITGYGNPNYSSTAHNWINIGTYYQCSYCGTTATSIPGISSIEAPYELK